MDAGQRPLGRYSILERVPAGTEFAHLHWFVLGAAAVSPEET